MKKVVIIGGGFCGAKIAKSLEDKFDVTLIDSKDYFEYTPSVLRTIVEPNHVRKIQVLHTHYLHRASVVTDCVENVDVKEVILLNGRIEFDYLVVASGSRYNAPFKEGNIVLATRALHLRDHHEELCRAKKVLIIGGGIVGIELAGEIIEKYPHKEIVVAHSGGSIIGRNHHQSIGYSQEYLRKKGVSIFCDERVVLQRGTTYTSQNGRNFEADMVFMATGIVPNSDFLNEQFSQILDERGFIKVDVNLRVKGYSNIFAGGDITSIREEKTAQAAENHAQVIARNICRVEKGREPDRYSPVKRPMIISLGKFCGILEYKTWVFTGIVPGILKRFVEWKTMRRYRS